MAQQTKTRTRQTKAKSSNTGAAQGNGSPKPAGTMAAVASKAKTPLIAGGAALTGGAAAFLINQRATASKGPIQRLRRVSLPKPNGKLDLSKVDLGTIKSTAERVSAFGQQAADVAAAAEKARKKHG
jgi:Tfp pilus assembly protein PilN